MQNELPEIYTDSWFYLIHDRNQNLTAFELIRETDNDSFTEFKIQNVKGDAIQDDDYSIVEEIAIDLIGSIGKTREFDSVRGETFYIHKVESSDYSAF